MNSYEMKAVSEKFISHLQSALAEHGIQLSVTNTKGTIIASSIEAFCGKFCAPAFRASERKQTVSASVSYTHLPLQLRAKGRLPASAQHIVFYELLRDGAAAAL